MSAQIGSQQMAAAQIEEMIVRFLAREIQSKGEDPVDRDENLFTSGVVDSVGIMRLIAHLESSLAVKIPPQDLVPQNFRTVQVMASYLEGLEG